MAEFIISAFADEAGAPLCAQIAALRRNGVTRIEPRNVDGKSVIDMSEEELKNMRAALDEAGITVGSLGSPIGKYPIHEPFEVHMEAFRRALRACQILGTKRMRMFSFYVEQNELSDCREEVLRRLRVFLDEAKEAGITLCHENESDIYGQMPAQVKDLSDALPDLATIFDPANYIRNGADVMEGIKVSLPHFNYMHIKDAMYDSEAIVPAGMGDGRFDEVLSLIDKHESGLVMLTVEPHLFTFEAYSKIDKKELKHLLTFKNSDESFDCAVNSIKNVLKKIGYTEGENHVWKK